MIEKIGPTVYNGQSVYNTGAGGGEKVFRIYTDFRNYDPIEKLDYPIIGSQQNPFSSVLSTTKNNNNISIIGPNDNTGTNTLPFIWEYPYKRFKVVFSISDPPGGRASYLWCRAFSICKLGDRLPYFILSVNENLIFDTPFTPFQTSYGYHWYQINTIQGGGTTVVYLESIFNENDGYYYYYLNGTYIMRVNENNVLGDKEYISPSPRFSGEIQLFEFSLE